MSRTVRFVIVAWLSMGAPARLAAAEETRVPVRMFDGLPLVEVSVNGARCRWFFVDTGSSVTTLSPALATQLGLQPASALEIDTTSGRIAATLGAIDSLRLGATELGGGAVVWHPLDRLGAPKTVDGVLGFDRLGRFNFLLDYGRRSLTVDRDGALTDGLRGERVAFVRSMGRPVIDAVVQVQNDPERPRRLVVDSGATTTVLLDRRRGGTGVMPLATVAGTAHGRPASVSVRVGSRTFAYTAAVILDAPEGTTREDQGLLPASLFAWMYFDVERGEIVWQRA